MAEQQQHRSETNFKNILFREIYKNTWLKKLSNNGKKKKEKLWVVFCVHDDTDAFLETYIDNKIAILHKPEWYISLKNIQHISSTICPNESEYEFALTMENEVIRLLAPTWDQMLDWVKCLREKLNELRILNIDENLYTKLPDKCQILLPTRDPTSPLPPTPIDLNELTTRVIELNTDTSTINSNTTTPSSSSSSSTTSSSNRVLQQNDNSSSSSSSSSNNIFNFDNRNILTSTNNSDNISNHYDYLFHHDIPGPSSTRQLDNQRYRNNGSMVLQQPPQSYKTFREQQVLQLQKEMKHTGGVRLKLRKKDCISSIALVDAFDLVWVCGWKQKEHPLLYNALHIGDQFLSIDGKPVKTAAEAHRILQANNSSIYVTIIIRRIPYGQVFVIHREVEGQPLGIIQENNTAVIETIETNSLVAKYGLTNKARTCDGLSFTNWVLTEINGRPLNLFYKKNQVKDRLNSIGRDISILVQPNDLIKQLKKQLKTLRNYKDYLLQ